MQVLGASCAQVSRSFIALVTTIFVMFVCFTAMQCTFRWVNIILNSTAAVIILYTAAITFYRTIEKEPVFVYQIVTSSALTSIKYILKCDPMCSKRNYNNNKTYSRKVPFAAFYLLIGQKLVSIKYFWAVNDKWKAFVYYANSFMIMMALGLMIKNCERLNENVVLNSISLDCFQKFKSCKKYDIRHGVTDSNDIHTHTYSIEICTLWIWLSSW